MKLKKCIHFLLIISILTTNKMLTVPIKASSFQEIIHESPETITEVESTIPSPSEETKEIMNEHIDSNVSDKGQGNRSLMPSHHDYITTFKKYIDTNGTESASTTDAKDLVKGDWNYSIVNDNRVVLIDYLGTNTTVQIDSKYKIDGKVYYTGLYKGFDGRIKHLSFKVIDSDPMKLEDKVYNFSTLNTLDLSGVVGFSEYVSNPIIRFYNNNNLTRVNFGNFDTSNITDMGLMFNNCSNLTEINLGNNFNTSNVTSMSSMFEGCSKLKTLDLGAKFNTVRVSNMSGMFAGCSSLTQLDLGAKFNTIRVDNMSRMFASCSLLTQLDLGSNFDTSNVTNISSMFSWCRSLTQLDLGDMFNTARVSDMSWMFYECTKLRELNLGNKFNTLNVTDMNSMFAKCRSLTTLNLGDNFNTSLVKDMSYMFDECISLPSLSLGNHFDTSSVTKIVNMFHRCERLTQLDLGDKFNTAQVTAMEFMFYSCSSLKELNLGNKFDASNVISTHSMFTGCVELNKLDLGDNFRTTSKLLTLGSIFENCTSLESLDFGNEFDTSSITNMTRLFANCSSLTYLNLGSNFSTQSVADTRGVFQGCHRLVVEAKNNTNDITLDSNGAEFIVSTANITFDRRPSTVTFDIKGLTSVELKNTYQASTIDEAKSLILKDINNELHSKGYDHIDAKYFALKLNDRPSTYSTLTNDTLDHFTSVSFSSTDILLAVEPNNNIFKKGNKSYTGETINTTDIVKDELLLFVDSISLDTTIIDAGEYEIDVITVKGKTVGNYILAKDARDLMTSIEITKATLTPTISTPTHTITYGDELSLNVSLENPGIIIKRDELTVSILKDGEVLQSFTARPNTQETLRVKSNKFVPGVHTLKLTSPGNNNIEGIS